MPPIAMPIRLLSSRVNFAGAGPEGTTVTCTALLGKGAEPCNICIVVTVALKEVPQGYGRKKKGEN
jgi:hypothetical protein